MTVQKSQMSQITEERVAFFIKRITIKHKIISFILKIRFLNYLIPCPNKMPKN